LRRLAALAAVPPPAALRPWAESVAADDGALPLLGTGRRADPYPALQWNGALLRRAGAPSDDGLVLVALAAAPPGATRGDVARGLAAGRAVDAQLPSGGGAPAVPTVRVLAAAACAAVTAGADPAGLGELLDLAATLVVVTPPGGGSAVEEDLWAGHALAAGWLAPVLAGVGLTTSPGSAAETLTAVLGAGTVRPPRPPGPVPPPRPPAPAPAAGDTPASELLAALR
jgi:hypothetical protein